jgi:tellurite resistance protein TerC
METIGTPALWAGFTVFVLAMLALDLGVFHRKAHEVGIREALGWSIVWVVLSLAFGVGIWQLHGEQRGLEYLTGYVIEKALAVDNIFVFVVLFSAFAVPKAYQHRVLVWGILGALAMRAVFIALGAALIARFHWVLYVFGALLVLTGIKLLWRRSEEVHPEDNVLFRWFQKLVPSVPEYHGQRFTVLKDGKRHATPLLLVLVAIEASDLVFALDSIPAIFAVTSDPFIVYTSNIFAILGLRAMYFLLADVVTRFEHLKAGLALVLVFVGTKMLVADVYKVPVAVSLAVVAALILGSVIWSLAAGRGGRRAPAALEAAGREAARP